MRTKFFLGTALAVVVSLAGIAWAYTNAKTTTTAQADCCFPGAECCFPGSPCCDDCCAVGASCCPDGPCCTSSAQTPTAPATDCCAPKLPCCEPASPCCLTAPVAVRAESDAAPAPK